MTNFSVTMSSTVRTFGGAPTSKWNAYNWNAFKWGEGTATVTQTVRMLVSPTNLSVASTQAVNFRFVHRVADSLTPISDAVNFGFSIGLNEALAPVDAMQHIYVQDPNGYFRVFHEGVTDLLQRSTASWSSVSSSVVSWTTAVAASTVWS